MNAPNEKSSEKPNEKQKSKAWFITRISRGFGRELASAAIVQGDLVICV